MFGRILRFSSHQENLIKEFHYSEGNSLIPSCLTFSQNQTMKVPE